MLTGIKRFFEEKLVLTSEESATGKVCKVQLATAALLFEVLKTDAHIDSNETEALRKVLQKTFALDQQALNEIIELAESEAQQATSLYEFTSLINAHFSREQKVELIENMWRIAFADKVLDKHEEHLIRRTADLIHIAHSEFIRSKLAIRDQLMRSQKSS